MSSTTPKQTGILLSALRHLQKAIEAGANLSYLSDIVDLGTVTSEEIDALCACLNVGHEEAEEYRVLAVSTSHLHKSDIHGMECAARTGTEQMLMERDTGFFLKLYEEDTEPERNVRPEWSNDANRIIRWAYVHGYRMIEFDADAQTMDTFPEVYEDGTIEEVEST